MENLSQLFLSAGTLMLVGMTFVFAFLGLLVLIIHVVIAPLAKKYPDRVNPAKSRNIATPNGDIPGVSPTMVAAISAAIARYRSHNKRN